jgi:hypothetical protein
VAMPRSRILSLLWLTAFIPSSILLCALAVNSRMHALTDILTGLSLALVPPLVPSLPGLLGSSLSLGRSKLSFAIWVVSTWLVQFLGLMLCINVVFNPELVAAGPAPIGVGPSRQGMLFLAYIVFVFVMYIGASILDSIVVTARKQLP